MNRLKFAASLALVPWLAVLVFFAGPVRWELAHGYRLLIGQPGSDLPLLTFRFSLPVLDAGSAGSEGLLIAFLFWAFIWLGVAWLIALIWRSRTREDLMERFTFGAAFYFGSVFLLVSVVIVGLLLPFAPLAGT